MSAPAISVLLPSFNQAEFLPEAIGSVLAQDFPDFELVISDGGSRDSSREVIASFAAQDARIRVCHPNGNPGVAGNWNHCLAQARGRYVKFLFSDDFFASRSALGQLRAALDRHPTALLATSAARLVGAGSEPIGERRGLRRAGLHPGMAVAVECLRRLSNFVGEPSLVMFRAPAEEMCFNGGYRHLLDLEFWLRLLAGGDLVCLAEPLTAFRQHPAQLSARNAADGTDALEARWLLRDALQHPLLGPSLERRHLFRALYTLRQRPLPAGARDDVADELMRRIGPRRYHALWLRHKLIRPFSNAARLLGG